VDGGTLLLATDLEMATEFIALIYRYRWQVELFFKWLKSILGCRHLMAESPGGVAIQIGRALIGALILQLPRKRLGKRAMELLRFHTMGFAELEKAVDLLVCQKTHPETRWGTAGKAVAKACRARIPCRFHATDMAGSEQFQRRGHAGASVPW